MLQKSLYMVSGSVLFVIGMILFPLPVPFGLPTMLIGLALMFKASDKVKRRVIRLSNKNPHSRKLWQKVRQKRIERKRG